MELSWEDLSRYLLGRTKAVRWALLTDGVNDPEHKDLLTMHRAADLCGVTTRTMARYKAQGGVSMRQAEDVADALREHPTAIWPNYYDVVLEWCAALEVMTANARHKALGGGRLSSEKYRKKKQTQGA